MCPYPYSRSYRSDLINEELKCLLTWLLENKSSVFNSFPQCSHTRITGKSHSTGAERASGTMRARACVRACVCVCVCVPARPQGTAVLNTCFRPGKAGGPRPGPQGLHGLAFFGPPAALFLPRGQGLRGPFENIPGYRRSEIPYPNGSKAASRVRLAGRRPCHQYICC